MTEAAYPIAITDDASRLHLAMPAEEGWTVSKIADQGAWPTWHPDGRRLAVSAVEARTGESTVEIVSAAGEQLRTVHRTAPGNPLVIAPGVPHYVSWSPGGTYLSYVAQSHEGLDLIVTTSESVLSERVAHGAPLFSAWSPDERFLAVHEGAELRLWDSQSHQVVWRIAQAVGFRAPTFTGDSSRLLYAVPSPPGVAITELDIETQTAREVTRLPGAVCFLPRPGTDQVAVGLSLHPESGVFDRLWWDATARGPAPVRGPFIAATWSPRGDALALVVPAQNGDGRFAVHAIGATADFLGATEPILVSGQYRTMLMFFDQYMRSHATWSPDGATFLLAGRLPGDGPHATFGDPANRVLAWRPGGSEPLQVVSRGDMGFFPPARP